MTTFDFPYHVPTDEYPQSGYNVSFGRGYSFASAPRGPDQLVFHLQFEGMFFWYDEDNNLDAYVRPELNARSLQLFYEEHRMYQPFNYQHPIRGLVAVRFNKPMPQLKPMKNMVIRDNASGARGHQVEAFQIDLIMSSAIPFVVPPPPVTDTTVRILREDGSSLLREDGSIFLREDAA